MCTKSIVIVFLVAASVLAQTPEDRNLLQRLESLERSQELLKQELNQTKSTNAALVQELDQLKEVQSIQDEEARSALLSTAVSALGASLEEANWSRATKSGMALRFYGFFRLDAYYQTARTNNVIVPSFVLPEDGTRDDNDDVFALDARLTRFAFDLDAGTIGDAKVTGKLETDFANFPAGVPESRETPRIRLAYINLDFDGFAIRMGQDWDIISPLLPAANNETLMWNVGNLGDRRPQIQFRFEGGNAEETQYSFRLSLGLTGAIDNGDLDTGVVGTERDGFDSGLPHVQARAGLEFGSWVEGKRMKLGAWGMIAQLETDTRFGGDRHFTPWTVGLDVEMPLFGSLSLRGELWIGQALSDFRGNIAQVINTATGEEISGWGGFAELVWNATSDFSLTLGGSLDNADSDDLGTTGRDLNWTAYLASSYNWGGGLRSGLDVIFWETQYMDDTLGNMVRINFYTQLNF